MTSRRFLALGNVHAIREMLDQHPHKIQITTSDPRTLAKVMLEHPDVYGVSFPSSDKILIETHNLGSVHQALPTLIVQSKARVTAIENPDDNLESILQYLVGGNR